MVDLTTRYMGLELNNPIIVGSCGMTKSVDTVKKCAEAGAGAVVLKSIFEEQIRADVENLVADSADSLWHPEAGEYIMTYGKENAVESYLSLIREAKAAVDIPVIASIHCVSSGSWVDFAKRVEDAGADGLELNIFVMPSDVNRDGPATEQVYMDIAREVKARVSIPVAVKLGSYFSSLVKTLTELSETGIAGLVMFNRFYAPDFDIDTLEVQPATFISSPDEYVGPLRWISIMSGRVGCDMAASTGNHDGGAVIKQILAGASAVQVVSTLYQNGLGRIAEIKSEMEIWMEKHNFKTVGEFRAKMSQSNSENPAAYERVQFMKTSVGIE